jgi:hypothetical protein
MSALVEAAKGVTSMSSGFSPSLNIILSPTADITKERGELSSSTLGSVSQMGIKADQRQGHPVRSADGKSNYIR